MRRRLGGSWKRRRHLNAETRELCFAIVVISALAAAVGANAQGSTVARKPAIALSVERCERSPFDVDAYEQVLAMELRMLESQPADGSSESQLVVRSPGCDDELEVSLRMGEQVSSELLRASEYTGVGQPRALALATIETLRVLTARLQAAPAPAVLPAASSEPPPGERALRAAPTEPAGVPRSFELYASVGAGLFDTLDWQGALGGAFALSPPWWLETELAFGRASDESELGSIDASALTLAVSLELRLRVARALELSLGGGLRGGAAWASADAALPLGSGLEARVAIAPVLLGFAELGAAYEVADGLVIGLLIEPGLGIEAAHFLGPPPAAFETDAAIGGRQPRVDLLGPGIYGALTLGYRF